jgi:hypothetical protein
MVDYRYAWWTIDMHGGLLICMVDYWYAWWTIGMHGGLLIFMVAQAVSPG